MMPQPLKQRFKRLFADRLQNWIARVNPLLIIVRRAVWRCQVRSHRGGVFPYLATSRQRFSRKHKGQDYEQSKSGFMDDFGVCGGGLRCRRRWSGIPADSSYLR
ncbi:MAG: hypothetical protein KBI46_06390 [Phycisphaerae bacterium]|nr:hypothetical protein [Phycisphaerae bacterium]